MSNRIKRLRSLDTSLSSQHPPDVGLAPQGGDPSPVPLAELGAGSEPGLLVTPRSSRGSSLCSPLRLAEVASQARVSSSLEIALSGKETNPSSPVRSHQFKLNSREVSEHTVRSPRAGEGAESQDFCTYICAESISVSRKPKQHLPS